MERSRRRTARRMAGAVLLSTLAVMGPWTVPGQPTPHAVAAGDVITGTITQQSNGDPLPGMRVQLFASNYGADILVTETTTDASGDYTLEGDQLCGTVFVQDPSGVLAYDQQWQCGSGTVDLTLSPGGTMTVTVTADDTGDPIQGACVYAALYEAEDTPTPNACTDAAGHAVLGLTPGFYVVRAAAGDQSPFIGGRFDRLAIHADGAPVGVGLGRTVPIAISMLRGHRVSGTVVADDTDAPLAGVNVSVWNQTQSISAVTDALGHYTTTGLLDGDYDVQFSAYDGTYVDGIDVVPVTIAGSDLSGVDGRVRRGVTLQGTVTDGNGDPIVGACVSNGGDNAECYFTDAAGHYTWGGLSGEWSTGVQVLASGYTTDFVQLDLPLPVNTHDVTLQRLGQVSGHVTVAVGGAPVTTGRVAAINVDSFEPFPSSWADVGADGSFAFDGLFEADFAFQYVGDPDSLLADEFYGGSPSIDGATVVAVAPESTTTGVDIAVDTGGTLSGTLTDQTGTPLEGAVVTVSARPDSHRTATSGADGAYTVQGLQSGLVTVHFDGPDIVPGYQPELFDEAVYGSELLVGVTAGQATVGIDADLQRLARITGSVVDDASDAPPPFFISVLDPITGASVSGDGGGTTSAYFADVVPGTYVVRADPQIGLPMYFDDAGDFAGASTVTVVAGQTLPDVDFRILQPTGPSFVPLPAPQRLVDSRGGQLGLLEQPTGSLGSDLAARMTPTVPRRFVITGVGGLPAAPGGIALNVVAVNPTASGYLTMYPCASTATAVPATSTLNFTAGVTIANSAIVQPDATGGVCVVASKATDLVLDATGWFDDGFVALPEPRRLFDSRGGQAGALEQPGGQFGGDLQFRFAAGDTLTLNLTGVADVPRSRPIALNIVAANPSAKGYLTIYPCGPFQPVPATSTLNFSAGVTIANSLVIAPPYGDELCVLASQATDVIVDVIGYYEYGFVEDTPVRLLDSRPGQVGTLEQDTVDGPGVDLVTPFQPGVPRRFVMPTGYTLGEAGFALNITAVSPSARGFVTVYPCASLATPVPATSTLNFSAGVTIANAQIIDPDPSDGLCVVASQTTHLIIDTTGTFE